MCEICAARKAIARALDGEISNQKKLPGEARASAVVDLAVRIRLQPKKYIVALATNLAIDGADGSGDDALLSSNRL